MITNIVIIVCVISLIMLAVEIHMINKTVAINSKRIATLFRDTKNLIDNVSELEANMTSLKKEVFKNDKR